MLWSPFCGKDIQSWLCARQCQWHPDTCAGEAVCLYWCGCSKHIRAISKNRICKCIPWRKSGKAFNSQILSVSTLQLWHFPNPVDRLASTMPCQICKTKTENSFMPCVFQSEMLEAKITLKWKWSKWSISNPKSRKSRHLCESKTAKRKRFAGLNPRCQAWNQHICDTHPFS